MIIRPTGAELFHVDGRVDGQTGMMEIISLFAVLRMRLQMVAKVKGCNNAV